MADENQLDENMKLAPATPQQVQAEESSVVEASPEKVQLEQATTQDLVSDYAMQVLFVKVIRIYNALTKPCTKLCDMRRNTMRPIFSLPQVSHLR